MKTLQLQKLARRHAPPIILLVAIVLLANSIALSGSFNDDPEFFLSGLGTDYHRGIWYGRANWYDPTIGFVVQTLGHACAESWLHGVVPWWNPYSGVGMPQAAELQNYAFFLPFVLLLHFHSGWLLLRVVLQTMSATFTYILLQQLCLSRLAASIAGVLYACMGSIILIAHAPVATFVFLPLLLIGIECAAVAAQSSKPMGWSWIVVPIAYSFYAGFPETAFIGDLFGAVWLIFRMTQISRAAAVRLFVKSAVASAVALGLILPGLIPFAQYLLLGALGDHASVYAAEHLPGAGLAIQFLPLIFGPLASIPVSDKPLTSDPLLQTVYFAWGNSGGWIGALPLMLAVFAMFSRNPTTRRLKWLLVSWIVFWEMRIFGVPGITHILSKLPVFKLIDLTRFAEPSCDFAIILLAAITLDDWQRSSGFERRRLVVSGAITFGILALAIFLAFPTLQLLQHRFAILGTIAWTYTLGVGILLLVVLLLLSRGPRKVVRLEITLLVIGSTIAGFALSQLAGASAGRIDHAGTDYIKSHIDLQRVFSMGPLAPNYGAEYQIAEIDYNMLPIPKLWSDYIAANLDHYADPIVFDGQYDLRPLKAPDAAAELRMNMAQYAEIGVKYVLVAPDKNPFAPLNGAAPRLVFQNYVMKIYELAKPAAYFSAPGCDLKIQSRTSLSAFCDAPTVLMREEQYYPGWRAVINGVPQKIARDQKIFQSIGLKKGINQVTFFFRPSHERLACVIALLSVLVWLLCPIRLATIGCVRGLLLRQNLLHHAEVPRTPR